MNTAPETVETEAPQSETLSRDPLTRLALQYATAGDRKAVMAEIWTTVEPQVHTLARRMLGNEADADDAVQEVAMILLRKLDTFTGNSQFSTWLHRVTVNAVLAKRQKRGRTDARYEPVPVEEMCDPNAISEVEEAEDARYRIDQALAGLSAVRREAIRLAYMDDVPNTAAASAMGIGVGAYKSHLHRGKAAMRDFLKPREADMGIWEREPVKVAASAEIAPAEAATVESLTIEAAQPVETPVAEPVLAETALPEGMVDLLVQYEERMLAHADAPTALEEMAVRREKAQRLLAELHGVIPGTAA